MGKKIIIAQLLLFLGGCAVLKNQVTTSEPSKRIARNIASDDYFAPRYLKNSPYRNMKIVDYKAITPGLNEYIASRPIKIPFHNQDQRWAWANEKAAKNKSFFAILPMTSEISNQDLLKNKSFLAKMNLVRNNPDYNNARWAMKKPGFAATPPAKLFAYQIFKDSSRGKPSILIWAKEHGDELAPPEFTTQLTEFFLFHLKGLGDPYLNKVIQDLFARLNVIIVPDMTPNKNLETFEKATTALEDFNAYGTLLQPFDYDSNDPDKYVLAPEAAYLKKLILGRNDLVLGIDIHTPYGIGVIAGPDNSVAENNRYLIAEAENTRSCVVNLSHNALSQQCQDGVFGVSHPTISGGTADAPSYFSRMKVAPSILLELTTGIPENAVRDSNCKQLHKEENCSYFVHPHLQEYLPYFLRLMEITAFSKKESSMTAHKLKANFASAEAAKNILVSDDRFFAKLSLLDMQLRLRTSSQISKEDFKNFVAAQAMEWEPQEQARVQKILSAIDERLGSLKLDLQLPKINFIKTTGKEEANFPYTRNSSIILPVDTLYSQDLLFTICHELFHIYTKTYPNKRAELYALIGFKRIDKNFLSIFSDRKKILTNPDVEDENVEISVHYKNQRVDVIPMILSKISENKASADTVFSTNVEFWLWASGGKLIDPAETDYAQIAGVNTEFDFHPEEILAENFAFLLTKDVKSAKAPWSITALMNDLRK